MGNLVQCKYFLQGFCRHGDRCRFYHGPPVNIGESNSFHPFAIQPRFASHSVSERVAFDSGNVPSNWIDVDNSNDAAQAVTTLGENEIAIILNSIGNDIQMWERDQIWPYSAYGPTAGRPSLPGMTDFSFEELRYEFLKNGFAYQAELEKRNKEWQEFCKKWSVITMENVNTIKALYQQPNTVQTVFNATSQSTTSVSNPLQHPSQPSLFSGARPSALSSFNFTAPPSSSPTMEVGGSSGNTSTFSFTLPITASVPPQPSASLSSFNFASQSAQSSAFLNQQPSSSIFANSVGFDLQKHSLPGGMSVARVVSSTGHIPEHLLYRRDELLSPEDIKRFEADSFDVVPLLPPSKKYC